MGGKEKFSHLENWSYDHKLNLRFVFRSYGNGGDNLGGKVLAEQTGEPEFKPQILHKKASVVVHTCNLSTKEADTGGFLEPSHH